MKHYDEALQGFTGFRGNVKITTDFDFMQFRLLTESGELKNGHGRTSDMSRVIDEDVEAIRAQQLS